MATAKPVSKSTQGSSLKSATLYEVMGKQQYIHELALAAILDDFSAGMGSIKISSNYLLIQLLCEELSIEPLLLCDA